MEHKNEFTFTELNRINIALHSEIDSNWEFLKQTKKNRIKEAIQLGIEYKEGEKEIVCKEWINNTEKLIKKVSSIIQNYDINQKID